VPYILLVSRSPMTAPSAAEDFHYKEVGDGFLLSPTKKEVEQFAEAIFKLEEAHLTDSQVTACMNGHVITVRYLSEQVVAAAGYASEQVVAAAGYASELPNLCAQGATAAANLPEQVVAAAANLPTRAVSSGSFVGKCFVGASVATCNTAKTAARELTKYALDVVADTVIHCGKMLKSSAGVEDAAPLAEAGKAEED